jgi:hypothetical protein
MSRGKQRALSPILLKISDNVPFLVGCFREGEMGGRLPRRQNELLSGNVMELAKRGELTIQAVSKELKTSYRQRE